MSFDWRELAWTAVLAGTCGTSVLRDLRYSGLAGIANARINQKLALLSRAGGLKAPSHLRPWPEVAVPAVCRSAVCRYPKALRR